MHAQPHCTLPRVAHKHLNSLRVCVCVFVFVCVCVCVCVHTEVVEVSCGIAPMLAGEVVENVASGIDCYSIRQPLGVRDV